LKVSKRGGFSDRNKIKPENEEIQLMDFDCRTRTQLQNFVSQVYVQVYNDNTYSGNSYIQNFLRYVLGTIYSEKVDATKFYNDKVVWDSINYTIANDSYDDVLTLIESLAQYWDDYTKENRGYNYYNEYSGYTRLSIFEMFNLIFQREYIGYRFVGDIITPISDENEVESINDAIAVSDKVVRDHLLKANSLLADREKPDYENSIKESISDANGIRHAGDIGGAASTFEKAKFMLVSCSAFINYLTAITAD
jgi:hypothetical protein